MCVTTAVPEDLQTVGKNVMTIVLAGVEVISLSKARRHRSALRQRSVRSGGDGGSIWTIENNLDGFAQPQLST
jgi:hypothetical protein